MWKRGEIIPSLGAISPLFHNILLPVARFPSTQTDFHFEMNGIRDKRSQNNESQLYQQQKKSQGCLNILGKYGNLVQVC